MKEDSNFMTEILGIVFDPVIGLSYADMQTVHLTHYGCHANLSFADEDSRGMIVDLDFASMKSFWKNPEESALVPYLKDMNIRVPSAAESEEIIAMLDIGIKMIDDEELPYYDFKKIKKKEKIKIATELLRKIGTLHNNMGFPYYMYSFLAKRGWSVPLFFAPGHKSNWKTALELKMAIPYEDYERADEEE